MYLTNKNIKNVKLKKKNAILFKHISKAEMFASLFNH